MAKNLPSEPNTELLTAPDEAFMERLRSTRAQLSQINEQRAELSSKRTALLAGLSADAGVNKHAMLAAIRYCDLKDEAKENWDLTYQVSRKAFGQPVQLDLFEAQVERAVKLADARQRMEKRKSKSELKSEAEQLFQGPKSEAAA